MVDAHGSHHEAAGSPAEQDPAVGAVVPTTRRTLLWRFNNRLTRRGRTLVIGIIVSLGLVLSASTIPMPFVGLGPGSTFNVLATSNGHDIISFTGDDIPAATTAASSGSLDMVTIKVIDRIPLVEAMAMWLSGSYEMAPRADYYPPDRTKEEVTEANYALFQDSQSAAEIAALHYLDYPTVVYVGTIEKGSPSWEILHPQDQITAIDDQPITDYPSLAAVMSQTQPGQHVQVTVLREGVTTDKSVTLQAQPEIGPQGFLGVGVVQRPIASFEVDISLEDIGGPSAGLMFTLGIIDRLTTGDLTGGKHIAGTGTINPEGLVGAIGGVRFKAAAAAEAGADYLLVPQDNCAEALINPPSDLVIVGVRTIAEAVTALDAIASDIPVATCSD